VVLALNLRPIQRPDKTQTDTDAGAGAGAGAGLVWRIDSSTGDRGKENKQHTRSSTGTGLGMGMGMDMDMDMGMGSMVQYNTIQYSPIQSSPVQFRTHNPVRNPDLTHPQVKQADRPLVTPGRGGRGGNTVTEPERDRERGVRSEASGWRHDANEETRTRRTDHTLARKRSLEGKAQMDKD
jgi:hypothetical protein